VEEKTEDEELEGRYRTNSIVLRIIQEGSYGTQNRALNPGRYETIWTTNCISMSTEVPACF
jgi:hypothetical protein